MSAAMSARRGEVATDSLGYVLGLLRRLKTTENLAVGNNGIDFLNRWCNGDKYSILKMCQTIQKNLDGAHDVVTYSSLSDEAEAGLIETVVALKEAFSLGAVGGLVQNYLRAIDSSITNFAIITSSLDIKPSAEAEIDALCKELMDFVQNIDSFELEPGLESCAKRHVLVLLSMLINVQALGIDSALSAYYDMLLALRRQGGANSGTDSSSKKGSFWQSVKSWSGRLESICKIIEIGNKAIPYLDDLPRLTGF
jgi:hypothetical protein